MLLQAPSDSGRLQLNVATPVPEQIGNEKNPEILAQRANGLKKANPPAFVLIGRLSDWLERLNSAI